MGTEKSGKIDRKRQNWEKGPQNRISCTNVQAVYTIDVTTPKEKKRSGYLSHHTGFYFLKITFGFYSIGIF